MYGDQYDLNSRVPSVNLRCNLRTGNQYHRILLNKRTVWIEFGKIFCRRGVVKHLYNRTPQ